MNFVGTGNSIEGIEIRNGVATEATEVINPSCVVSVKVGRSGSVRYAWDSVNHIPVRISGDDAAADQYAVKAFAAVLEGLNTKTPSFEIVNSGGESHYFFDERKKGLKVSAIFPSAGEERFRLQDSLFIGFTGNEPGPVDPRYKDNLIIKIFSALVDKLLGDPTSSSRTLR